MIFFTFYPPGTSGADFFLIDWFFRLFILIRIVIRFVIIILFAQTFSVFPHSCRVLPGRLIQVRAPPLHAGQKAFFRDKDNTDNAEHHRDEKSSAETDELVHPVRYTAKEHAAAGMMLHRRLIQFPDKRVPVEHRLLFQQHI